MLGGVRRVQQIQESELSRLEFSDLGLRACMGLGDRA